MSAKISNTKSAHQVNKGSMRAVDEKLIAVAVGILVPVQSLAMYLS